MRALSVAFFERVAASPERALLRVAGRVDPALAADGPPSLLLDDGRTAHRFEAIKAPDRFDTRSGAFALAFAVPAELTEGRVAYALDASGTLLDLPAPRERRLGAAPDE